ncbi:MAG: hypothetical protein WDW36_008887 [Sanguina aurantia]
MQGLGATGLHKLDPPSSSSFGEISCDGRLPHTSPGSISPIDQALVQLYTAGCQHYWTALPDLADAAFRQGASEKEVWATVRHLIVFAGYASCLAATSHLRLAGKLKGQVPGKVGGPPGDAFEKVYDKVTDAVRAKLHDWDPVLAEYIRLHLYGDVYSSPGLGLRQKQLLTVSFLGEADMHDQLYTHAIAAMRFGASHASVWQAVEVGFQMSARPNVVLQPIIHSARAAVDKAAKKVSSNRDGSPVLRTGPIVEPVVTNPDPTWVRVPPLPPPFNK